jgi:hypothetical protein
MNRGALWFISVASVLGGAIPLVFRFASRVLGGAASIPPALWSAYDYLQLMLWPMPLLLVPSDAPGAPDLDAWGPFYCGSIGERGALWCARRIDLAWALPLALGPRSCCGHRGRGMVLGLENVNAL